MFRSAATLAASFLVCSASLANNCEAIRAQIEAKIKTSGVSAFTLSTVEAEAKVSGRVVGTCDLGTRKIVYVAASAPASGEAKRSSEAMLTECKDGSVSRGGDCKK